MQMIQTGTEALANDREKNTNREGMCRQGEDDDEKKTLFLATVLQLAIEKWLA